MSVIAWTINALKLFILQDVECLNLIGWRTFLGVQLFSGKRPCPYHSNNLCYFKGPYSIKQQKNQNPHNFDDFISNID